MNFLIDAQLPKVLAYFLRSRGFDAIHTLELPNGNITEDDEIRAISFRDSRVVISKDKDFYDSYAAKGEPYKLLYLTTGNISNPDLIALFDKNLLEIVNELQTHSVVELNRIYLISIA